MGAYRTIIINWLGGVDRDAEYVVLEDLVSVSRATNTRQVPSMIKGCMAYVCGRALLTGRGEAAAGQRCAGLAEVTGNGIVEPTHEVKLDDVPLGGSYGVRCEGETALADINFNRCGTGRRCQRQNKRLEHSNLFGM